MKKWLFLLFILAFASFPVPNKITAHRSEIETTIIRRSASTSKEGGSGNEFDINAFVVSGVGIATVGGVGTLSLVFWTSKRKKTENKPAKTIESSNNEEQKSSPIKLQDYFLLCEEDYWLIEATTTFVSVLPTNSPPKSLPQIMA